MNIGTVILENITLLAPLAGITNLPFRLLARQNGCGLVCSEMVSANGLVHGSKKTEALLATVFEEKPLSVQVFGSDSGMMADAAAMAEGLGADILDINFGCAVKKILKSGAGAALMRNPRLAEDLLKAVRGAITIPLTVKMRSGWDPSGKEAFRLAAIAQNCGVNAVTLHPRTAAQKFSGKADWSLIAAMKRQVSIPVIGNGDIAEAEDAIRMLAETGCDAVMVGRAAIGNPWIFSQIKSLLAGEEFFPVSLSRRAEAMERYLSASVAHFGELQACRMMRSRLGWFVKGLPNSSRFRQSITQIRTQAEAEQQINAYMDALQG
jgi:tRNA-dihydrouridine synthase B